MSPKIIHIIATNKMVMSSNFKSNNERPFDLQELAQKCRNVNYNPSRFRAAILRISGTKLKGIVFSSGNITIYGGATVEECQSGANKLLNIIRYSLNLSHRTCYFANENIQVRNIVASYSLG